MFRSFDLWSILAGLLLSTAVAQAQQQSLEDIYPERPTDPVIIDDDAGIQVPPIQDGPTTRPGSPGYGTDESMCRNVCDMERQYIPEKCLAPCGY